MNRRAEFKYLFLTIIVFIVVSIDTDIYLPAFPDMMEWFSASESEIQTLLTWNFVGVCLSGPFYGPISDSYGRKKPIVVALALFLIGSVISLFSQNLNQMLTGRILQGIGAGGCFTLRTAIIFDVFKKEKAISALNKFNTAIPLIRAASPMIGGYLNYSFGFRANFLLIALLVLTSFVICLFFLDETVPEEQKKPIKIFKITQDFKQLFFCLSFWQLALVTSVIYGGYIAFLSGTSILFVIELGMKKTTLSWIQAAVLGSWVIGSLTLTRSITKWGIPKIKKTGILFTVIGGLLLSLVTWIAPRDPYLLTGGMLFYTFGSNWIIGLYFPEGMETLPHIKGVAASLLTSARLLIAALVIAISGALYNATIYPLTAIVVTTVAITFTTLFYYEKRKGIEATPAI